MPDFFAVTGHSSRTMKTAVLAAALVREDRIQVYGYGKATQDGAVPDAHTLFEIGSVTRLFTTLTLATMVADGEVALDEPVADLLPPGGAMSPSTVERRSPCFRSPRTRPVFLN